MIKFSNWTIKAVGPVLCRQHDNKTHTVEVIGDIPEGWTWKLLLEHKSMSNIILMEQDESGLHVVLKQEDVPLAGTYKVQLQGTNGELKKHTNQIFTEVRPSIPEQGEAEWPELPSALEQYEQRVKDIIANMGPDWNQNDPEQPSFIKNRTHYTEIFTFPIYRDYSVEELTETNGEMPDFPPFYGGDTVEVIVDGVKYNCVAQDITNIAGELPPENAGSSLTIISDISFDPNLPVTPKWVIIHEDFRQSLFIFSAIDPVTLYVPGVGEVEVDPGRELEIPPGYFPSFKAGDTVTITVDGVEHSLIAVDYAMVFPDADQEGATGAFICDGDLSGWDPTSGVAPPATWIFANMEFREQHIYLAEPQPPVPVSFFTGEYGQREEVKQIPGKYIPPSDWEQNDENGIGYIKNRPCYEELVENYVLCDYKGDAFTGGPGASYWTYVNPMPGELIVGEIYAVESSNEVRHYICRLATEDDIGQWTDVVVGLPGLSPVEDDTDLDFWISTYPVPGTNKTQYCMSGTFGWWGNTIKITGPVRVIKKLDQKFIDAPVLSVNGKTGVVILRSFDIEYGSKPIYFQSDYSLGFSDVRAYGIGIYSMDDPRYGEYPIASIGHNYFLYYDPVADMFKFALNEFADSKSHRKELTGLADPTLPESAATKNYVDSTRMGKYQTPEAAGRIPQVGDDGYMALVFLDSILEKSEYVQGLIERISKLEETVASLTGTNETDAT